MLERIRVVRLGHPTRLPFVDFRQRYEVLTPGIAPFLFKAGVLAALEERRDTLWNDIFSKLQGIARKRAAEVDEEDLEPGDRHTDHRARREAVREAARVAVMEILYEGTALAFAGMDIGSSVYRSALSLMGLGTILRSPPLPTPQAAHARSPFFERRSRP